METGQPRHHGSAPVDVDAIDLLSNDHRLVREYFQHIESVSQTATAADRHRKPDLVRQLCDELDIHAQIEEEIFYPISREHLDDEDMVDEAVVEHQAAKDLIEQIEAMEPSEDLFDAKVKVLQEQIEHHVEEEEQAREGMFAQAREAGVDVKALLEPMLARKQELKAQAETSGLPPAQTTAVDA